MIPAVSAFFQVSAIVLISLVAGSTFGIWRGYDPHLFSQETFLEVHQGAVRGLNVLLPALAMAALAMTAVLAFMSRGKPSALWLYGAAILGIVAGGIITRFTNQPINAQVMSWTLDTMPADWAAVRDTWWHWHVVRTGVSVMSEIVLIAAVFADRNS